MSSSGDWEKCYSEKKQAYYWFNRQTNTSTWTDPTVNAAFPTLSNATESTRKRPASEIEEEWVKRFSTSKNAHYWFNTNSGTSTWVDPTPPATTAAITSAPTTHNGNEIPEDSPLHAVYREHYRNILVDKLTSLNSAYGPMLGDSKTSRACAINMREGLQGIYARIIWSAQLNYILEHGDVTTTSDAIYPIHITTPDTAVIKELIDAGRSPAAAESITSAITRSIIDIAHTLLRLSPDPNPIITIAPSTPNIIATITYCISYTSTLALPNQCTTSFDISGTHLAKLLRLYRLYTDANATHMDKLFVTRVFCVLARYETLSGSTEGYQMAFPDTGFSWLRQHLQVTAECFASPLNCYNSSFFSIARDTDRWFGSRGNFFCYRGTSVPLSPLPRNGVPITGGSFEANPPFVESIMAEMAKNIEVILSTNQAPFSFVIIIPGWDDDDCECYQILNKSRFARPHTGYKLVLDKKQHNYRPGMQHRASLVEQPSNVNTFVFFMQNEAGATKWPVSIAKNEELKKLLRDDTNEFYNSVR